MKTRGAMPLADANSDREAMQEIVRVQHQLSRIRKSRKWSLNYVGIELDVHPSTVWRWENNPAYSGNVGELQMYARFLGYTLRVLVVADDINESKTVVPEDSEHSDGIATGELRSLPGGDTGGYFTPEAHHFGAARGPAPDQ
ncbi:helix-turn-helix domain-containing protein [Amycolatopsis sp. lyj-108]|uniref:helix-turn-helix domain-containing protein n=1 Tax=Amycolatopsis sp. lyj-108 TaxID=2789286 RepID=UPI00397D6829